MRRPTLRLGDRMPAVPARLLFGVALILLGVAAIAMPSAFDDDPDVERVPGNPPVNAGAVDLADIRSNNSPTVVRNPTDGQELAVANRVDSPRFSCGLNVSRNGGARWDTVPIPAPRGEEPKCYAPDVAYDAAGTLYLSFVTLRGRGNVPNAVWLSRLRGRRLTRPRKVLGKLSFQVRLTADPETPRRLYLTWLKADEVALFQFTNPGNPISFIRTNDGGRNWTRRVQVNDPRRERVIAPSLAVGKDGELHALFLDLKDDRLDYSGAHRGRGGDPYPGPWELVAARSVDGGRSWQESMVEGDLKPIERFIVFIPAFPSIAADPDSDRVYAAFHDRRLGDPDVYLWRSSDGGESWSGRTRVNDTPERDERAQYLPKVSVAPNGRVDVLYYDRRRDRRDIRNDVSFQPSFDDGETFADHTRLSDTPFSSRVGFGVDRRMPDLGSRLGLISADTAALGVWTDTRAGNRVSRKQDLAAGFVTFSRPARMSGFVKALLRVGGVVLLLVGAALLASLAAGGRLAGMRHRERPAAGAPAPEDEREEEVPEDDGPEPEEEEPEPEEEEPEPEEEDEPEPAEDDEPESKSGDEPDPGDDDDAPPEKAGGGEKPKGKG